MTPQQSKSLRMIGIVSIVIALLCVFTGNFSPLAGWLGGMALTIILSN
jgi:uncharacterized membrane protein YkgB